MKIVSLVGARPQYIKEAVINQALKQKGLEEVIVNSGQHYDTNMADVFFKTLGISPAKHNLCVGSGKHGEMTAKIITGFETVLEKEKPDMVLVYGDTDTTLAGAIVATKMKIPLGHIEAGIRMSIKDMPEEINRVLTDHSADLLFTPTKICVANLKKEGITKNVFFTGDVTYDLFLKMQPVFCYDSYKQLALQKKKYILVTLHRDFNVDTEKKLECILKQLNELNKKTTIVFPMHPRTKARIAAFHLDSYVKDMIITEPLDYLNLMGLLQNATQVITDSGGLTKEAYFAEKRCLVLMADSTSHELLATGYQKLCDGTNILESLEFKASARIKKGLFGNGDSGYKIAEIIKTI